METVLHLAKINADQARLGNLLKLAIDHDNYFEVERLIAEIRQTQQQLKDAVNRCGPWEKEALIIVSAK